MKKVLIIVIGMMASSLSAMPLPKHFHIVEHDQVYQYENSFTPNQILISNDYDFAYDQYALVVFEKESVSAGVKKEYKCTFSLIDQSFVYYPIVYDFNFSGSSLSKPITWIKTDKIKKRDQDKSNLQISFLPTSCSVI